MKLEDMIFEVRGPSINPQDIAEAERQLRVALPQDYREFLLKYNGGSSRYCESEAPFFSMKWWYSICDSDGMPVRSLVKANAIIKPTEFGDQFISIGENIMHWHVIMKTSGKDLYRIGSWDVQYPPEETELPFSSFSDMLAHLVQKDDPW